MGNYRYKVINHYRFIFVLGRFLLYISHLFLPNTVSQNVVYDIVFVLNFDIAFNA